MDQDPVKKTLPNLFRAGLVSFGFIGYFPFAPGTAGSAGALVILLLFWRYLSEFSYPVVTACVVLGLTILGIHLGPWAVRHYGNKDPKPFVLDEAAALFLAAGIQPKPPNLFAILLAFFIFRLLDIFKPFPAGRLQQLPHGFGIVLDDTAAGIYTHFLLRICLLL